MQTITDDLQAILKSKFQAAADGFRARVEIDGPPDMSAPVSYGPTLPILSDASHHDEAFGGHYYANPGDPFITFGPGPTRTVSVTYTCTVEWISPGTTNVCSVQLFWAPYYDYDYYWVAYPPDSGSDFTDRTWTWTVSFVVPASASDTPVYVVVRAAVEASNTLTAVVVTDPVNSSTVTRTYQATRVSIDKSLQTDADAFEIEFDNADGSKSLYPAGDTFLPTRPIRIFQWYGDSPNVVQVFEGFIDKVQEHRNPRTLTLTGRCWMKRLLVQDILVTAPQGADEDGAVRDPTNFVYLNMEVSDIVLDLLAKANYPADKIGVQQTSYQVAEFLGSDGNSFADALGQLADMVGYNSGANELGRYVFEANARTQSTDTDTPDAPEWTFRASEDISVIDPEQDDYDLKTRIRVTGPMSTTVLNDAFTELWHSSAIKKPTGVWFDSSDAGNVRVADGATRKLYKVSQSTQAIVSSTAALCSHFLGDVTGDPSDASKYWILELPWKNGLPGTASTVYQLAKSDNSVLASFALPSGRWVGMDVDATHVWLANWDTNQIHCYTRAGASVAAYTLGSNVDPTGVIVDGTTLYTFWYNTNQILVSTTSAPTTITKTISTAGTQMLGGEVDSVTHTEFWACSDSLGLTWKYTLVEPVTTERTVYVEATNDAVGVNSSPGLSAFEVALGEVRRSVVRMDAITSLAQATETAQRWLGQLDHTRQQLDVGIIGNPAIQKGDMVRIEDPVSGIASDWGVDTYRSEMSGEAGTYLGTLSLLPWSPEYN